MKKNNHTVLVVAAHPDDELLGVAGTLLKHIAEGDAVHILILGDGENARDEGVDVPKRADNARAAARRLGASSITLKSFTDNQFDAHRLLSIVKVIEQHVATVNPDIIYTHHAHDLNIDHQRTCQAVMTAVRPVEGSTVRKILLFETVSSTEWQVPQERYAFCPNEYVNIESYIEEKIALLKIYNDEMRPFPHPRSYEGLRTLAQKRGMEVGYRYAEAFHVVRNLRD